MGSVFWLGFGFGILFPEVHYQLYVRKQNENMVRWVNANITLNEISQTQKNHTLRDSTYMKFSEGKTTVTERSVIARGRAKGEKETSGGDGYVRSCFDRRGW